MKWFYHGSIGSKEAEQIFGQDKQISTPVSHSISQRILLQKGKDESSTKRVDRQPSLRGDETKPYPKSIERSHLETTWEKIVESSVQAVRVTKNAGGLSVCVAVHMLINQIRVGFPRAWFSLAHRFGIKWRWEADMKPASLPIHDAFSF